MVHYPTFIPLTVLVEEECAQLSVIGPFQSFLCRAITLMKVLELVTHQLLNLGFVLGV